MKVTSEPAQEVKELTHDFSHISVVDSEQTAISNYSHHFIHNNNNQVIGGVNYYNLFSQTPGSGMVMFSQFTCEGICVTKNGPCNGYNVEPVEVSPGQFRFFCHQHNPLNEDFQCLGWVASKSRRCKMILTEPQIRQCNGTRYYCDWHSYLR